MRTERSLNYAFQGHDFILGGAEQYERIPIVAQVLTNQEILR